MLRKEIKSKFQLLAPLFWSKFEVFHEKVAGKVLKLDETLAPPGQPSFGQFLQYVAGISTT